MPAATPHPPSAVRFAFAALALLAFAGCQPKSDGKIHLVYWEKWTGFEAAAMQQVVNAFNRSQDRIVVDYLSVGPVDQKTIVATAGGDPPDVAGLWVQDIASFADNDALTPLDGFIRHDGLTPAGWLARYYPVYASMCLYRGKIYGLPSTPSVTALHWNKRLFREAGLDPDRPPRTLAELDAYARKLTRRDPKTGDLTQVGFLPQEPGFWPWGFYRWFGGRLWDGHDITLGTDPANLAAMRWVRGYTEWLGLKPLQKFISGFGDASGPQGAFFHSKVAMVFQGVWLNHYIGEYAPGLDYGVAAWPAAVPGVNDFGLAEADMLVIPRGAKHPAAAWEFIKYVNSSNPRATTRAELRGMELLCYLQQKNSPLRDWSPYFAHHHPHPYIGFFRALSTSPHVVHIPYIGIWDQYNRALIAVFQKVWLLQATPRQALDYAQHRLEESWLRHERSLARHGELAPAAAAPAPAPASPPPPTSFPPTAPAAP